MSKKSSTFAVAFGNKGIYGGYSSVGRASDCGSECRGFEPHYPPKRDDRWSSLLVISGLAKNPIIGPPKIYDF